MNRESLLQIFLDRANNRSLMKYAIVLTGSMDDAMDLVSDLLLKIYTDGQMQDAKDPMAYFRACLKNMAINKYRKDNRLSFTSHEEMEVLQDGKTASQSLSKEYEEEQARQELEDVLSSYSSDIREAFIQFYLEGYSLKELAKKVNMRENTLSQQFRRMRKKVAKYYGIDDS